MIYGIDVSRWQGTIDWDKVAAAVVDWGFGPGHIRFAGIRSSVGDYYTDFQFSRNYDEAERVNIIPIPYHVNKPAISPDEQSARFKTSLAGRIPVGAVLDCELRDDVSTHDLRDNIYWCLRFLEDYTHDKNVIIYTADWFWSEPLNSHALPRDEVAASNYRMGAKDWALWVASYGDNDEDPFDLEGQPVIPVGWETWKIWQFTSKAVISGITENTVDADLMQDAFFQQLGGSAVPPPPPPDDIEERLLDLEAQGDDHSDRLMDLETWAGGFGGE